MSDKSYLAERFIIVTLLGRYLKDFTFIIFLCLDFHQTYKSQKLSKREFRHEKEKKIANIRTRKTLGEEEEPNFDLKFAISLFSLVLTLVLRK